MNKCRDCDKEGKYYNGDYTHYFCAEHYVENVGKECFETELVMDSINYDQAIMRALKDRYPDFYKKYPKRFDEILQSN